jgi:hypothetical protein
VLRIAIDFMEAEDIPIVISLEQKGHEMVLLVECQAADVSGSKGMARRSVKWSTRS